MTDHFTKSINNFNITLEELDNIDKYKLIDIHDSEVEPVKINRKIPGEKIKSIEVLVKLQNN